MCLEVLIDESKVKMNPRGKAMLDAMRECSPCNAVVTSVYRGDQPWLMLYGAGSASRKAAMAAHLSRGGHVITWDMGYWDKDQSAMRLSIDALHPTTVQIQASPTASRREFVLREDASEDGPILLAGMGRKSAPLYGFAPLAWERAKLRELRCRFPGRLIAWRPKTKIYTPLLDAPARFGGTIESALDGCALVVCRHSNVAIDACIAGVPVECEDGAAIALYSRGANPDTGQRLDFLSRLSHWNYAPNEAHIAWNFIQGMLQ